MLGRISVSAAALVLALAVPLLEVNQTHLFNAAWPAHARLHEAWQLLANAALSLLCLWLVWAQAKVRMASMIMLALTGSFLVALAVRHIYGGSMQHTDGGELMIAGVNPAAGVMAVVSLALIAALVRGGHETSPAEP